MKKIAVITGGLLPLPSIKGGAIETLLQYFIDDNENTNKFQLEVYSIYDEQAKNIANKYKNVKFKYIKINEIVSKIHFNILRIFRRLGYKDPNFQKFYISKVTKQIKENEYDLILIESDNHFVLPIKKHTKVPIILYLHNDKLNNETKDSRKIAEACSGILTVSKYIKDRVLTIDKKYDLKTEFILNGIDTEKFNIQNKEEERKKLRNKYNLKEDDFVFLFTGRIEPNKGILELVKAFNKIQNEKAKLMILGGSFYSSNGKTKYTKEVEKEIGNSKKIIVTGYVPHKDIPQYHIASDCMVTPSLWEEPRKFSKFRNFCIRITFNK